MSHRSLPGFARLAWHFVVLLVGVLGTAGLAAADDEEPAWPQFHGPRRDNLSTETGLLKQWPEGGPRRLWTAQGLGHGYATVSLARGMMYTSGNIGGKTVITALDLAGRTLWQVENGKAWEEPQGGARGTPTIGGEHLYHENPYGDVVCLEAKTGKKVWGLSLLTRFPSKPPTWGLAESLLMDGDRVICCPGGSETAVVALDKRDGRTLWKSPSAGTPRGDAGDLAGYASPVLVEHQGLRMIMTLTSKAMIGVNADTGDLLWRFEHVTPFDENILMPLFHDGHVFVCTRTTGSVLLRIDASGGKASVTPVWRSTDLDNQHGGVVLVDGYLYGSCLEPRWVCLEWRTGRTMYDAPGVGKGSVTYADGMLYTLGEKGRMGLVKATPTGHDLVSEFRIPEDGQGPSWAHPVVCGGRLYIRHGDFLHAYEIRLP